MRDIVIIYKIGLQNNEFKMTNKNIYVIIFINTLLLIAKTGKY